MYGDHDDETTIQQRIQRTGRALWQSSDKSAGAIEDDLGITRGLLYKWQQRQHKDGADAFRGSGKRGAEQEHIRRLENELAVLRQEREILKISGSDADIRAIFNNPKP